MDLTVTDPQLTPIAAYAEYTLDLAFGDDENNFELSIDATLEPGSLIMVDGTEIGGIIDAVDTDTSTSTTTYKGRSWSGILSSKILCPNEDEDYLTVNGTASNVIEQLLERTTLNTLFSTSTNTHPISFTFERYTDLYSGLRKMLAANSLKARITSNNGKPTINVAAKNTINDTVDSDALNFKATKNSNKINHLVCLGTGELKNRTVIHWYADQNGNLSHTQTITGIAERTAKYDYANASSTELEQAGHDKLTELRQDDQLDLTVNTELDIDIDDIVTTRDNTTGITATATIGKKIITIKNGKQNISYEPGNKVALAGNGETGGGGGTQIDYAAGPGISIVDRTISAEVTGSDFEVMDGRVTANAKAASDASAAAANALGVAQRALKPDWNALVNMPGFMGADEVDALF